MDILMCVDVGSSQTKVIYHGKKDRKTGFIVMPPELEEIPRSKLNDFIERRGWVGVRTSERESWVIWNNRLVVLGEFASYFDPQDRIKEIKYENALWKILCAVGLIVEKLGIKPHKRRALKLNLGLLLPWNEYSDRDRMLEQLKIMLSEFQFRSTVLKVNLESFLCRPEGGGLASARIKTLGKNQFCEQNIGVLMFGHRNTTALYFKKGRLEFGDSPLLGFSNLLDMVIEMTSGLDRKRLLEGIYKARNESESEIYNSDYERTYHPEWATCKGIQALANARDRQLRSKEIRDIAKAISTATDEYWYKLERWISSTFNKKMDEVIIGGGAAYHIEPELERYFNCRPMYRTDGSVYRKIRIENNYRSLDLREPMTPMLWGAGFEKTFIEHFQLDAKESISHRLLDCFGLFSYLLEREYGK